jgi:hypothetical protein
LFILEATQSPADNSFSWAEYQRPLGKSIPIHFRAARRFVIYPLIHRFREGNGRLAGVLATLMALQSYLLKSAVNQRQSKPKNQNPISGVQPTSWRIEVIVSINEWRRCVGIEPTHPGAKPGRAGFEDQEDHQTQFTSGKNEPRIKPCP